MDLAIRDELLQAIHNDDSDAVSRLVERGAEIGADPRHGNTAMRSACQLDALRSIEVLLNLGADPNERITFRSPIDKRVEQDFTPLFYAKCPDTIDLLVQFGADVNAVSASGLSALMRFSHFGRDEMVESLLRHGADVTLRQNPKRGRKARTALEFAKDSLEFWESLPKEELKPEANNKIEAHRKTVDLLVRASTS